MVSSLSCTDRDLVYHFKTPVLPCWTCTPCIDTSHSSQSLWWVSQRSNPLFPPAGRCTPQSPPTSYTEDTRGGCGSQPSPDDSQPSPLQTAAYTWWSCSSQPPGKVWLECWELSSLRAESFPPAEFVSWDKYSQSGPASTCLLRAKTGLSRAGRSYSRTWSLCCYYCPPALEKIRFFNYQMRTRILGRPKLK